jgi:hypothetical protein
LADTVHRLALLEDDRQLLQTQLATALNEAAASCALAESLRSNNLSLERVLVSEGAWRQEQAQVAEEEMARLRLAKGEVLAAQREVEGWFCELRDLRETVEHVEQLRDALRLRRGSRESP